MKKAILAGFMAATLAGCASMADSFDKMSGVGQVTQSVDSFDNSRIIKMEPSFLFEGAGNMMDAGVKLGAYWTSRQPDEVALMLSYASSTSSSAVYVNFSGMDVNIDGEVTSFKAEGLTSHDNDGYNSASRTIYTESRNYVPVPRSYIQKMMAAKACKLKIYTSDGYVNADFTVLRSSGGQGAAKHHLSAFLQALPN